MRIHGLVLTAPLVLFLAVAAPARATDTLLAEVDEPTPMRTYAGVQVWSTFDGAAYRLTIRRAGAIETLPAAPSRRPFDVDIGPDRSGRPLLAYTRCGRDRVDAAARAAASRGCDVVVYSLAGGSGERPLHAVNTAAADEFLPSIWRGRIAFARRVPGSARTSVFTRRLGAPRSERSERLPGGRSLIELDLQGDRLGAIADLGGAAEVRLIGVSDRRVRRLQRTGVGEGGQSMVGIGFAGGYLAWGLNCLVSCGERLLAGVYRYHLSTGDLARATPPLTAGGALVGVALFAPDGAYLANAHPEDDGCGMNPSPGIAPQRCQLLRSRPLAFRPVRLGQRPRGGSSRRLTTAPIGCRDPAAPPRTGGPPAASAHCRLARAAHVSTRAADARPCTATKAHRRSRACARDLGAVLRGARRDDEAPCAAYPARR
jgi:hypothetical protein